MTKLSQFPTMSSFQEPRIPDNPTAMCVPDECAGLSASEEVMARKRKRAPESLETCGNGRKKSNVYEGKSNAYEEGNKENNNSEPDLTGSELEMAA